MLSVTVSQSMLRSERWPMTSARADGHEEAEGTNQGRGPQRQQTVWRHVQQGMLPASAIAAFACFLLYQPTRHELKVPETVQLTDAAM